MNIAYLTSEYPHPKVSHGGGIGTSIKNLANGLVKMGHHVWIFVVGQDVDESFNEDGICIVKISDSTKIILKWWFNSKKVQSIVNQYILAEKIELIELPDWTGQGAFIHLKCPVVVRLNGSDTYFCHIDNRRVKWKNRFLEMRNLKKADKIISVSEFTAKLTAKLFNLDYDKMSVVPNGIDVEKFPFHEIAASGTTILYLGTLIRKKGAFEIPKIFNEVVKQNNQVKLILVGADSSDVITGSSSTWNMMQKLFSDEAKALVDYKGKVSYSEVAQYIREACCCIFPSYAEAFPYPGWKQWLVEKRL